VGKIASSQRVRPLAGPMTGSAKQSTATKEELDCFFASLLAMAAEHTSAFSRQHSPEFCKFIPP